MKKKKNKNAMLQSLAVAINKQESRLQKPDNTRIETLEMCCDILEKATDGATIEAHIHEPFKSMGFVSLSSKAGIIVDNPQLLAQALLYVSNIEACPKTDGSIQIDFTFHGLAKSD